MQIRYGYCHCGCNQLAPIASRTRRYCGHIKGLPIQFINGHRTRIQPKGEKSHAWKGGIIKRKGRYLVYMPEHPRANSIPYILRYILIAEKAMNKSLPSDAVIHHINAQKDHDVNNNLIVCENDGYHKLIHQRKRAFYACGHASWRKCSICGEYDDPDNLYIRTYKPKGGCVYHRECKSQRMKAKYYLKQTSKL